jgi:N-acetyl-gamma-glutamyl-phosphate reductase
MQHIGLKHKTYFRRTILKPLIEKGVKVVDLSADYRLPLEVYEKFYVEHTDTKNLKQSVYGLPELFRDKIKKASLVANPGCFPTSAILPILPFLNKRVKKYSNHYRCKNRCKRSW